MARPFSFVLRPLGANKFVIHNPNNVAFAIGSESAQIIACQFHKRPATFDKFLNDSASSVFFPAVAFDFEGSGFTGLN